jgi:hypothetical protein
MENLLSMPTRPFEVLLGKIIPYILIGYIQVGVILIAGKFLFGVPMSGSLPLLLLAALVFIVANLAMGITFSTIARNQLQAVQMSFFCVPAVDPARRLHVPVPRDAGVGAVPRRGAADHALPADRARDHVEGERHERIAAGVLADRLCSAWSRSRSR